MSFDIIIKKLIKYSHVIYNSSTITTRSIGAFNVSTKGLNDENNKQRESIIGAIINNKIPNNYYNKHEWAVMKGAIQSYLAELTGGRPYVTVECIHKGGRKHNHDFDFKFLYVGDSEPCTFKVELKFNALSISHAPQYSSPMKPSQYMSDSYEEYYYTNYLNQLSAMAGLPMPTKEDYLKQIHFNSPICMTKYKELYDTDQTFHEFAKKLSHESIEQFIKNTELNIDLLSAYLFNTQKDKVYMLYSNNAFILQHANMDDYIIEKIITRTHNRYECSTKSGKTMKILLRWKNGNGIAFPAFQIS